MRLLHTTKFTLHSFVGPEHDAPHYAILSHTWEEDEVLFEDMATSERMAEVTTVKAKAWAKIQRSCAMARTFCFDYIWIDTLCIDKSSSAELSEAINSMFEYYAFAGVCLAYISDYKDEGLRSGVVDATNFLNSRWFTRGWTLQELIVPSNLVFYDMDWLPIGNRHFLANAIASKTSIYRKILARRGPTRGKGKSPGRADNLNDLRRDLTAVCVAAKMKWVSTRQTKRPEDVAYCMLGLFNVNMPLLYGEGAEKAFIRLQEEIIKHSFDQTILTWQDPEGRGSSLGGRWDGILSPLPASFAQSDSVQLLRGQPRFDNGGAQPDGLGFEAVLCPVEPLSRESAQSCLIGPPHNIETEHGAIKTYLAILHCCADGNYTKRIALLLYKDKTQPCRYYRAHRSFFVVEIDEEYLQIDIHVRQSIDLNKATETHIVLCSPPTQSWHSKQGYWPCGYNWKSVWTDWKLVDWLECKLTPEGPLDPKLPSWLPDGDDLEFADAADPKRYKINGILLFERHDQDAFFVIWGSAPSDSMSLSRSSTGLSTSSVSSRWWESSGGYFSIVVEWEVFTEMPYNKGDIAWLIGEWHSMGSTFFADLLRFCQLYLAGSKLSAECSQSVGARNRKTMVNSHVLTRTFLGVEGLVVGVFID
ncbi:heterokaryon incompatibility protein-domain-containing protein [Cercophora newfieldiana]|uniref:Heterokaryon incompatibility protein-domain-containing protein n=1 Tax=Cercophora newfieldiana TaxID=92897 RepID=A0AA40CLW1_9PEZI|nr:heterokaryon incompatibility protein-domain-containing protein [Cercophora newfieldiana]